MQQIRFNSEHLDVPTDTGGESPGATSHTSGLHWSELLL